MDSERQATTRVFISATSGDLASVREIVKQGLLTMHCLPVEQTNFGPDYRTVTQMLEERIGGCDAVVHLVGLRYGAEPDPATLPAGAARRSYTQLAADSARRLKKKLFVFVCPEDFGYDAGEPEPEEKAARQRAYREEVLRGQTLYTSVTSREDVAQRVRELRVEVEKIRAQMGRQRRRSVLFAAVVALLLIGLGAGVWWNSRRTLKVVASIAQDYAPEKIEANLRKRIRERAEEEIQKLDAVKDWPKVIEIEKARDQQLGDVERLLEEMHQAYAKQEVSANYALASQILAEKGVKETLQFLAAKNTERESRIASLKRGMAAQKAELRQVLQEKLLAASLLEKNLQFDQAMEQYRAVIADDQTWAEPRIALAWLLTQRGEAVEPAQGNRLLSESVELSRQTLAVTSRDSFPQDWAVTLNNLGIALTDQGERTAGAEGPRLLGEAVASYREALQVYTRAQWPQDRAVTLSNLGIALRDQGERTAGAEGSRLLGEAVAACREALQTATRAQSPRSWAMTQNNLAGALEGQSQRAAGAECQRLLGEAVACYRNALQVYTREQVPQKWAMAQNNLGDVLRSQGERADPSRTGGDGEGPRLLGEAAAAYRNALQVYTREQWPKYWATAQTNLGTVLMEQGERAAGAEGPRLLSEAEAAFREALRVRTREQLPQDWASTQISLAITLGDLGEHAAGAEGPRLLDEAVATFREVLQVYTRERSPQYWAMTQTDLGNALKEQGKHGAGAEGQRLLREAVAAQRAALEVYTREQLPYYWTQTAGNLSEALKALAEATGGEEGTKLQAEAEGIDRELAAAEGK